MLKNYKTSWWDGAELSAAPQCQQRVLVVPEEDASGNISQIQPSRQLLEAVLAGVIALCIQLLVLVQDGEGVREEARPLRVHAHVRRPGHVLR